MSKFGVLILTSNLLFINLIASDMNISNLKNPFFIPTLHKIRNLKLQAIFLDKVKIDGIWYKKDDFIYGAKIININNFELCLKYNQEIFKISLINDKININ